MGNLIRPLTISTKFTKLFVCVLQGLIKYIEKVLDITIENTTKELEEEDNCAGHLFS